MFQVVGRKGGGGGGGGQNNSMIVLCIAIHAMFVGLQWVKDAELAYSYRYWTGPKSYYPH